MKDQKNPPGETQTWWSQKCGVPVGSQSTAFMFRDEDAKHPDIIWKEVLKHKERKWNNQFLVVSYILMYVCLAKSKLITSKNPWHIKVKYKKSVLLLDIQGVTGTLMSK